MEDPRIRMTETQQWIETQVLSYLKIPIPYASIQAHPNKNLCVHLKINYICIYIYMPFSLPDFWNTITRPCNTALFSLTQFLFSFLQLLFVKHWNFVCPFVLICMWQHRSDQKKLKPIEEMGIHQDYYVLLDLTMYIMW